MMHLGAGDVEAVHLALVEDFRKTRDPIDPPGLRSRDLLESAVFRLETSLGGELKYPSLAMAAAALLHALIHNHPFHNGNKRTALVSMIVFLHRHGLVLRVSEDELYQYVVAISDHRIPEKGGGTISANADREMLAIARWLRDRMHRVTSGEFCVKFHELRRILEAYDSRFVKLSGNRMNISRGGLQTQITCTRDGMDVMPNTVHKIRRDLELDEEHGYDTDIFYNSGNKISAFIVKYRGLLYRLR